MGSKSEAGDGGGGKRAWPSALAGSLLLAFAAAPSSTESAIANGDTRTITLSDSHTNESGSFTYMVNGYYDAAVLEKLNWFLRDWRLNEQIKMDPKLFDIIWDVYRQSGSKEPIDVLSGYRSPQTNAMLRRRSRQVAEHSQHMEGRAIDAHFVDVGTATIRDIAMREQSGGVGFYPTGSTPWVHIDSGSVRYWPRMNRDALTRLFPDGKTVFIPADGQPMPGYEQARAEIEARGGAVQTATTGGVGGLFGWLFGGARGGGADDAEESGGEVVSGRGGRISRPGTQVATAAPDPVAVASRNLPRGETFAQAAPADAASAQPASFSRSGPALVAFAPSDNAPAQVAFPPPAPAQAAAAPAPQVEASLETDTATDAGPVSLRGPIAAKFIAPLPPRKPLALGQTGLAAAPMPPSRPQEFALASDDSRSAGLPASARQDLIAALLERGKLPGVITHGVHAAPSSALALADPNSAPEPRARPGLLERAAALAAPLPPPRPTASGVSTATRSPATSAPAHNAPNVHGAADPYGGLIYDAFNVQPRITAPVFTELRGSTP